MTSFLKREDTSANFNSSGKEECSIELLNMICKGAETISDSDFNNFGGILLKVVALEGFSSLIPFLIFSMETFSNEK